MIGAGWHTGHGLDIKEQGGIEQRDRTGGGVAIEEQYRARHSTGQGIAGEAAIGAGWHRGGGLGIEEQGGIEQRDRTGIG